MTFTGFVGGDSQATALRGAFSRTYSGPSTPNAGTYTDVFGLSAIPSAVHGNYEISLNRGDLRVRPADLLLVTIHSQSSTYGTQVQRSNDLSAVTRITAQYCLNKVNCSTGVSSLELSRISETRWRATDITRRSVEFETTINNASYSNGRYLNVGYYDYDITDISLLSLRNLDRNFNGTAVSAGALTVNPLSITASVSARNKLFDGNTSATATSSISGLKGDDLEIDHVGASFINATVGTNKTVTVFGLSLSGDDAANYRLTAPILTTTASIRSLTPDGPTRLPPVIKPIIPDLKPLPNPQPSNAVSRDDTSGIENPFSLSVEPEDCRPDNLVACVCDPNPMDETMDICYVPKRSAQRPIAEKPNT